MPTFEIKIKTSSNYIASMCAKTCLEKRVTRHQKVSRCCFSEDTWLKATWLAFPLSCSLAFPLLSFIFHISRSNQSRKIAETTNERRREWIFVSFTINTHPLSNSEVVKEKSLICQRPDISSRRSISLLVHNSLLNASSSPILSGLFFPTTRMYVCMHISRWRDIYTIYIVYIYSIYKQVRKGPVCKRVKRSIRVQRYNQMMFQIPDPS